MQIKVDVWSCLRAARLANAALANKKSLYSDLYLTFLVNSDTEKMLSALVNGGTTTGTREHP